MYEYTIIQLVPTAYTYCTFHIEIFQQIPTFSRFSKISSLLKNHYYILRKLFNLFQLHIPTALFTFSKIGSNQIPLTRLKLRNFHVVGEAEQPRFVSLYNTIKSLHFINKIQGFSIYSSWVHIFRQMYEPCTRFDGARSQQNETNPNSPARHEMPIDRYHLVHYHVRTPRLAGTVCTT